MRPILSVSQFIEIVNQNLEHSFGVAQIEGEISGYRVSQDKWVSFSLKDEQESALVECWGTVWQIKNPLEDGMKVVIEGRPQLRAQNGRFSVRLERVTPTGEGALKRAFELLKLKLENEGLFDTARKRDLPEYPAKVGLITSKGAEAYKDFMTILNQRWGGVEVQFIHVQVQGIPAAGQIVKAIDYFNHTATPAEILVLVRGGGSLEDLQAFNEEAVVRAVAGSRTPTVVGVGHEGDVSLADMAADVRAATPTDAAKKIAPERRAVGERIDSLVYSVDATLKQLVNSYEKTLRTRSLSLVHQIQAPARRLDNALSRLKQIFIQTQQASKTQHAYISSLQDSLLRSLNRQFINKHTALTNLVRSLRAVNPQLQLKRGYAIIRHKGQVIKTAEAIRAGDELMLQLAKDRLKTEVKNIYHGNQA